MTNQRYFILVEQIKFANVVKIRQAAYFFPAFDNSYPCLLGFAPLFALNTDIQEVHNQLERYFSAVSERAKQVAYEIETVFRQKIELGLFGQPRDRI